jgi:hypothetical protein
MADPPVKYSVKGRSIATWNGLIIATAENVTIAKKIADALNAAESKRQWDEAIAANREEHEA